MSAVIIVDANRVLRRAEAQCIDAGAMGLAREVGLARAELRNLLAAASKAERLLQEMAEAGFGDPTQADELRISIHRVGGAA